MNNPAKRSTKRTQKAATFMPVTSLFLNSASNARGWLDSWIFSHRRRCWTEIVLSILFEKAALPVVNSCQHDLCYMLELLEPLLSFNKFCKMKLISSEIFSFSHGGSSGHELFGPVYEVTFVKVIIFLQPTSQKYRTNKTRSFTYPITIRLEKAAFGVYFW